MNNDQPAFPLAVPELRVPARDAAEDEAVKRERHKPKSLHLKRWAAVHNSVRGWHVALIDNHVVGAELAERAKEPSA